MQWLNHRRLKSNDAKMRERAINSLAQKAGVNEIKLFAQALNDENPGVRTAAAKAIGMMRITGPSPCVEEMLPWLTNSDLNVRRTGATALKLLGWIPSNAEQRVLNAIAFGNFDQIRTDDEPAVEHLLALLKISSSAIRTSVAETFQRLQARNEDPRTVEPLIELLDDPDLPVRVAAMHALSKLTDPRRIPPLLKLIDNSSPHLRTGALEAIGRTGRVEYLPRIVPALKDPSFEVRVAATIALSKIKSPDALDPVITMLKDPDTDVRKTAVECLARMQDPRSVKALIFALVDKESVVRHGAANALQIINFQWRISEEAQKAIPFLEAAQKDDEYWVREAATKALARIKAL